MVDDLALIGANKRSLATVIIVRILIRIEAEALHPQGSSLKGGSALCGKVQANGTSECKRIKQANRTSRVNDPQSDLCTAVIPLESLTMLSGRCQRQ